MDLQPLELLINGMLRRQQSRHHDHRAQGCRNPLAQRQRRQDGGVDATRDDAVQNRHSHVDRWNHSQKSKEWQPRTNTVLASSATKAAPSTSALVNTTPLM